MVRARVLVRPSRRSGHYMVRGGACRTGISSLDFPRNLHIFRGAVWRRRLRLPSYWESIGFELHYWRLRPHGIVQRVLTFGETALVHAGDLTLSSDQQIEIRSERPL